MPNTKARVTALSGSKLAWLAVLAASSIVLNGCASGYHHADGSRVHEHYAELGVVPAADEFSVEAAQRICSIDALTTARDEMRTVIRNVAFEDYDDDFFYDEPNQSRTTSERIESRSAVTARPYGPQTEAVELVRSFETDLDAAYRFATSSCQAYAMCMHQQAYEEYACNESRLQWRESQVNFNRLSERLAEIRLEISQTCADCRFRVPGPHHRPYGGGAYGPGYGGHGAYDRGYCRDGYCGTHSSYHQPDCDNILGDVFTTSTCNYPRPRTRPYYPRY